MRILIVSDTHGNDRNFERVLMHTYPVDAVFHLGDLEGSEAYIEDICPCPVYMVRGNNDFYSPAQDEQVVELAGHRILMTHGHRYGVSWGNEKLKEAADFLECDMVFYGHTHRPEVDLDSRMILVNPGSLTYPRQQNRFPSYVLGCIHEDEASEFSIIYLE